LKHNTVYGKIKKTVKRAGSEDELPGNLKRKIL
jgi:hypothetical protein